MKLWLCAIALSVMLGSCVVKEDGYHHRHVEVVEPAPAMTPIVIDEHYHHHHHYHDEVIIR